MCARSLILTTPFPCLKRNFSLWQLLSNCFIPIIYQKSSFIFLSFHFQFSTEKTCIKHFLTYIAINQYTLLSIKTLKLKIDINDLSTELLGIIKVDFLFTKFSSRFFLLDVCSSCSIIDKKPINYQIFREYIFHHFSFNIPNKLLYNFFSFSLLYYNFFPPEYFVLQKKQKRKIK